MSEELRKAKEERAKALKSMEELTARIKSGNASQEERTQFNKHDNDFEAAEKRISDLEAVDKIEKKAAEFRAKEIEKEERKRKKDGEEKGDPEKEERNYEQAYLHYLMLGKDSLHEEHLEVLNARKRKNNSIESRIQSTTPAAGGYLIPEGFSFELTESLKYFGGIFEAARIWTTPTGNRGALAHQ